MTPSARVIALEKPVVLELIVLLFLEPLDVLSAISPTPTTRPLERTMTSP